ncbi:MAG: hypothetical protein ACXWYS_08210 [Gaiellaceae bacterium]
MILIPAASAMPVLSDSMKAAPAKPAVVGGPFDGYITRTVHGTIPSPLATPAIVSGPMDGYITRTADGTIPSPAATTDQPLVDSWYTPGVLGSTQTFSVGRTAPDVPPVAGRALPVLSSPSGFNWADAGLGIALGAALAAFVAFGAQRSRRARHVPVLHSATPSQVFGRSPGGRPNSVRGQISRRPAAEARRPPRPRHPRVGGR